MFKIIATVKQGDIVLVPIDYTDLSGTKKRPTLVISSDRYNERRKDMVILAITSQIPPRLERDDYKLSEVDLRFARLNKPSIVKVGKILTMDKKLILRKLGRLKPKTIRDILQVLVEEVLPTSY